MRESKKNHIDKRMELVSIKLYRFPSLVRGRWGVRRDVENSFLGLEAEELILVR